MSAAAPRSAESRALCTQCGLSCDGTLFLGVIARPEDLPTLARHALPMDEAAEQPSFLQPCRCFAASICTIYEERPSTCRSFRCKLLRALDRGEVTLAAAQARVASTHATLVAAEPAARTAPGRETLLGETGAWRDLRDPAERVALAGRHIALVALSTLLGRHVRDQHAPTNAGDAAPAPAV